jgi:elongation factor P--(R)-beta-lysine ligase
VVFLVIAGRVAYDARDFASPYRILSQISSRKPFAMTRPQHASPWWSPVVHADRRPLLLTRNRIQARLRLWLADEGFTEVDPAGLQVSPGNEAHLHAFACEAIGNDGAGRWMYLHTSPEFAMKKLLAAGETRIAAFAHVWRNRERGALHSPEFTMLEWYRVGEDYSALMEDCAAMLRIAAEVAGARVLRFRDRECDPFAPFERLSVAEAFQRYAGIDLRATIAADGAVDAGALRAAMGAAGLRASDDDTWSDMLSKVLVEKVEPNLGIGRVTVLDRYPAAEAALARRLAGDPKVAERFEVYACGVELANGFGELTNPEEQRRRFGLEMDEKARVYGERYPLDEDFLAALGSMPEASGIAMGFDRVVMLAVGAPRIDDVLWVPVG